MTKKIIALVLFVAMMVALVPVASATPSWADGYTKAAVITGTDKIWYAKAVNEALTASGKVIGEYNDGDGVKITLKEEAKKTTVTIEGSYDDLQAYYYDYTGNTAAYGKAVKIPFIVFDKNGNDVTGNSYVNGGTTYYAAYITADGEKVYYLNFALQAGGNKGSYFIKYQNNDSYEIAVEFKDTDTAAEKFGKDAYAAKLEVVGVAGLHVNNFRAEYTNGKYVAPKAGEKDGYFENGTLTFNIAAWTADDRTTIWATGITEKEGSISGKEISRKTMEALKDELKDIDGVVDFESTLYYKYFISDPKMDDMIVRLKAYDRNGAPYAPGTIVMVKDKGTWRQVGRWFEQYNENILGYSEKFVNVDGKATYLVDRDGCIALKMTGIGYFADLASRTGRDYKNQDVEFLSDIGVYRWTMVQDVVLQFVKTNNGEETNVKFDIVFQNIPRTESGVTLLAEEMEVVVGDTVQIPYIIDNPYALTTALKSAWVSTNDKIVAVTDDEEGYIKAKAAGKAYVYCTDALGKVKLVIVNAVAEKKAEPAKEEVVVPATTKYVVTASRLNFREGPATSYKSMGLIERNTVVEGVEAPANGWIKVSYNGKEGYCSGKYLAEIN